MSEPVRKYEIREANQALILEAAERVFALSGYQGATTEQIAREAGLPKANVHYYFKTKLNIYREVLKRILEDWMKAASTFEAYENPEEALRVYITAKMEFSRQRPFGSRVWAREIMSGSPVMENFLGTTLRTWLDERIGIIQGWINHGKINAVDPHALLYMIWASTQHYADFERQILILNGGNEITDREFQNKTDQVIKLILASVGL